jgi:hypothetical protein
MLLQLQQWFSQQKALLQINLTQQQMQLMRQLWQQLRAAECIKRNGTLRMKQNFIKNQLTIDSLRVYGEFF